MICIIPARGRSQRIPRKNIRLFHGKPIISYPIELAKKIFNRVIVSTEDDEIGSISTEYGAEYLRRPEELSEDYVGTQIVMQHVVNQIGATTEIICCLYPTTPLVEPKDIWTASSVCAFRPSNYVIAVAENPLRDIGNFYIGQAVNFKNNHSLYNLFSSIYVMPEERAIDINTEEDWKKAEQMYAAIHFQQRKAA